MVEVCLIIGGFAALLTGSINALITYWFVGWRLPLAKGLVLVSILSLVSTAALALNSLFSWFLILVSLTIFGAGVDESRLAFMFALSIQAALTALISMGFYWAVKGQRRPNDQ